MSKFYVEKNNESTFELFNKRLIYIGNLEGANVKNLINMNKAEKILYGRIDSNFKPILLKSTNLKEIVSSSEPTNRLKAVNFVADQFEKLVAQFQKCRIDGKISSADPFLSTLKAFKAYSDPIVEYENYKNIYFNTVKAVMQIDNKNIRTFDDMIRTVMPVLKISVKQQPITFPGFLKSKNCSVMSTGLAIEIANSDYINDDSKVENFISSPNWDFYLNACNEYGFMVDINVPWRIIADIGTDEMIKFANNYASVTNAQELLFDFYTSSSQEFFIGFKQFLFDFYNSLRQTYIETHVCAERGTIREEVIVPEEYTFDNFQQKYSNEYFIELFVKLRIYEEAPSTNFEQCQKIVKQHVDLYKATNDMLYLYECLECELNKTFDIMGSLSYYNDNYKKRILQSFDAGDIEAVTEGGDDFSGY